jgi:hypothetical protein
MIQKRYSCLRFFLFIAVFCLPGGICPAQMPSAAAAGYEAEIWQKAVAKRAESVYLAPGELSYEHYHFSKKANELRRETGVFNLSYDENGRISVFAEWAKFGERDFTAERNSRLEKQASKRNELLEFFTPFDSGLQAKLERERGTLVYEEGRALWQYVFRLPVTGNRSFEGIARVSEDGSPHDFRFWMAPMPWFMDDMYIRIAFGLKNEFLVFNSIDFKYKASFLFWVWNGGGEGLFDKWKWLSAQPRFN